MNLSVLMAVYGKDDACFFRQALESVLNQTLAPDEIVLVQDGLLSDELAIAVRENVKKQGDRLKVVALPKNVGLASALNAGLRHCSGEWVARMDADDVCLPDRFECQMGYLREHPRVDVLSSWIEERDEKLEKISYCRKVPATHEAICRFAKWRNPMNHMTVVFRKEVVLAAGGYPNYLRFEDYALWATLIHRGAIFSNIPRVLLRARTGEDFYMRRSGWEYVHAERQLLMYLRGIGLINFFEYSINLSMRFFSRILPPFAVRFVYDFLRGGR